MNNSYQLGKFPYHLILLISGTTLHGPFIHLPTSTATPTPMADKSMADEFKAQESMADESMANESMVNEFEAEESKARGPPLAEISYTTAKISSEILKSSSKS